MSPRYQCMECGRWFSYNDINVCMDHYSRVSRQQRDVHVCDADIAKHQRKHQQGMFPQ